MTRWIGTWFLALLVFAVVARADIPPVYGVIFTHIEDNTPAGALGSTQSRQSYLNQRSHLIQMAALAESSGVQWVLQPDWKMLEAALLYEDSTLKATTRGQNFLVYLKEHRGVVIDAHSHENGGYNYTDVAHLLDSLGVGATTVIGGHIWDPSLPQFQEWDRFRAPVPGEHYPGALWRGDILMGSGTPNHVNDPTLSGVWRPRDRDHYFEHDPAGNIAAIGQWKRSIASVSELFDLYRSGAVPTTTMLTFSFPIPPATINGPGGLEAIADTVIAPLKAWIDSGLVIMTDFTSLIETWEAAYGGVGYLFQAPVAGVFDAPREARVLALARAAPNPVHTSTLLSYSLARPAHIRLSIFDIFGREVAVLANGPRPAGDHALRWDAGRVPSGVYVCQIEEIGMEGGASRSRVTRKLIVAR